MRAPLVPIVVATLALLGPGCRSTPPAPSGEPGGARVTTPPPGPAASGQAPVAPRPPQPLLKAPPVGPISVRVHTRTEWIAVPVSPGFPGSASVVAVRRALDPATSKAYDPGLTGLGGDPRHLARGFRLPDRDLLLGEPILVELRVEVPAGRGWKETIGGNYRGRGRDDNVVFVLRRADGYLVPDTYPGPAVSFGGLSTQVSVSDAKPFSYWLAVQRYAAIVRPGTYELFCIHLAHGYEVVGWRRALAGAIPAALRATHRLADRGNGLVEMVTGRRSRYSLSPSYGPDPTPSPLGRGLPADVAQRLGPERVSQIADLARFRIVVRRGSAAERRRMVARWSGLAGRPQSGSWPTLRETAAREAIGFARQDDFLALIGRWLRTPKEIPPQDLHGLAMRTGPAATRLLLSHLDARSVNALAYLPDAQVRDAMPVLIGLLTHPDGALRSGAEHHLVTFSGQRLGRTWDGFRADRPTPEEGRRMQPLWRAWWQRSRGRFVPAKRPGP